MRLLLAIIVAVAASGTAWAAPQDAAPREAQVSSFIGKTVKTAQLVVDGEVSTDEALLGFIETRPGQPLSMLNVRETIAHLYSLGRSQDIFVDAEAAADGVIVRFHVNRVRNIEKIEFSGNVNIDRGDLRQAITERFGATPLASRAANVAEMLQGYYFDHGYPAAAIRPVLNDGDKGTILTFEIESGPRAFIRAVNIIGDPGVPRAVFLQRIDARVGEPYQRIEVQRRLAEYVDGLRRSGRYEAQASHRVEGFIDDGRGVDLAVTVDLGPEVIVRFEGDPLPKNRTEELVPVRREGSIDADIIEDSEARITAFLSQQGYWKAKVSSARREVDGRIEIVFTVTHGPKFVIATAPAVSGNTSIPAAELQPYLQRLKEGDVFVAASLDAAAAAIQGEYLRRGFAQTKIEAVADEVPGTTADRGGVTPRIVIKEGPQLRVGDVTLTGNTVAPTADLKQVLQTVPGRPFYAPEVLQDRERIQTALLNRGFATASVDVRTNPVEGRVDVFFVISEGPQSILDHVLVVGNQGIDEGVIQREVQVKPGQPLGLEDLFETRRRLAALGLFRSVRIREIPHGDSNRRDLVIEVEESPATTIGYGGGVEIGSVFGEGAGGEAEKRTDVAPRGFFEVGRRRIGGRNRSANLYTRLSLRSDLEEGGSTFGFPEYRVVGTYREPRTFGWNADVALTGGIEQGVRSTFNFSRKGVIAEMQRRLFDAPRGFDSSGQLRSAGRSIRLTGRYTFETTKIFDERLSEEDQLTIDRIFPQVRLSMFGGSIARDTRDDLLDPSRGTFVSAEGSFAAESFGGNVGFLKTFLQMQGYRRLPVSRRVVVASRLAIGMADGFPRVVSVTDQDGTVHEETIEDLPASERFFAGGDATIRGYALDAVGAPNTITPSGFPRGGNGLILANVELRVPLFGQVAGALFVDGGNVFQRVTQIDLGELRGSVGFGVRYGSPLGPLRLDMGFKLDRRDTDPDKRGYALHFSFGQAF